MSRVIIHDFKQDESIRFLCSLYDLNTNTVLDYNNSNSAIRKSLKENDEIWMLGHGYPGGLFSKGRGRYIDGFERELINSTHVQFLRNKTCVGIWCYANRFAEKYNLKGLFSGMVISEVTECEWVLGYRPTQKNIDDCNKKFVDNLDFCLKNFPLSKIPQQMVERQPNTDPVNKFNFNSLFYYGF